jgi:hypothetical protein
VVVDRGPCVVLEQWLYSSGLWSVRGTRAVVCGSESRSVSGFRAVSVL